MSPKIKIKKKKLRSNYLNYHIKPRRSDLTVNLAKKMPK